MSDNLQRDEVRGIFVLGVIGTLLALWQLPNTVFTESPRVTLHIIIVSLTVLWGLCIFFMVIGVSDDWMWERLVKISYSIAKILFLLGIAFLSAIFIMIGIAHFFGVNFAIWAGIITAFLMGVFLIVTQPATKTTEKRPQGVCSAEDKKKQSTPNQGS
jgi:hypothetical protein